MSGFAIDLRGRYTLTVPEAGQLVELGRDSAYAAVHRKELPSQQIGRRIVVPTIALLRQLGWTDALIAQALGITPEMANEAPASAPLAEVRALTKELGGPQYDPDN